MDQLEKSINRQRGFIEEFLAEPLSEMAGICASHWSNREELDFELKRYLERKTEHRCRLLYAIDNHGLQHSSSISDFDSDNTIIGRNLSERPYLARMGKGHQKSLVLSDVYIDKKTHKPCITALHSINIDGRVEGYIAADFGLKDLPLRNVDGDELLQWRQIKGDAAILLSSGYSSTDQVAALIEKGCRGFIQKPYDTVKMSRTIRTILDGVPVNPAEEN